MRKQNQISTAPRMGASLDVNARIMCSVVPMPGCQYAQTTKILVGKRTPI